jgi:iron complex outermembrane receptor protein
MSRFTAGLVSIASCLPLLAVPAHAQTAPGVVAPTEPDSRLELEEVVVTAQKTSTNLQTTSIAITALSSEQIERNDLRSIADLDREVPGLQVMSGGAFPLNVTIRGVGFDGLENNSAQPGVAFVQNGVYIASPLGLTASFLDLKQIEVLRGPQGTVNGQNADGGAINVTTGMPSLDGFHADSEVSYGSYNYDRVRAVANVPLTDTFAVRAAVQHEGHSGWLDAPDQPYTNHTGNEDAWTERLSALWKPNERLSIDFWTELFDNDVNGLDVRNPLDPIADPRGTSNDYPTPQETHSRIAATTLAYDLDFAVFKSISSYQYVIVDAQYSSDLVNRAAALDLYGVKDEIPVYVRQSASYTEEINLSHTGGWLDWIVGSFFLRSHEKELIFEDQQSSPVSIPYTPSFFPTPGELGALYGEGLAFESASHSKRTSIAGYSQATFHATDALRITAGVRYSWDKYTSDTSDFFAVPVPLESKFDRATGKATIEYDIVPASTVYAGVSTGVKPGGTNLNPGALVVPTEFKNEFVRAYEIGSKNELLDRRLRVNVSAFYNDYRNLQEDSEDILPYDGGITNIPKSHVYGLEVETSVILPAGFRVDANSAMMRSGVDSHFFALDPDVAFQTDRANGGRFVGNDIPDRAGAFQDLYGSQLARVPHFAAGAGITKSTDLGGAGKLDLTVQGNYRSAYWARIFNNPAIDWVGHEFTMNFNAHYQPRQGPWYLEFQVTNLTGSNDVASRFPDSFGVGAVYDALVPPRQFIGRFGVNL